MSLAEENREVLAAIVSRGTDLSAPRVIAFYHLLYSELTAYGFKRALEDAGYQVRLKRFPSFEMDDQEDVWDVTVPIKMIAFVEDITRKESELAIGWAG